MQDISIPSPQARIQFGGAERARTDLAALPVAVASRSTARNRPRFGIVHVDHQSQQRKPKASAQFFRSVVRANGLPAAQPPG